MAADLTDRVREIAHERGISESEVLERALERGVEDLWNELVLTRYLNGEIARDEAVELVGANAVRRAEREVDAVEDDVRWGLNA